MDILPKKLNTLLEGLLSDSTISGWILYAGSAQKLVINFEDKDSDNFECIQYKRKSQKQITRDTNRANKHKYGQSKVENESHELQNNRMQTRSLTVKDSISQTTEGKECARSECLDSEALHTPLTPIQYSKTTNNAAHCKPMGSPIQASGDVSLCEAETPTEVPMRPEEVPALPSPVADLSAAPNPVLLETPNASHGNDTVVENAAGRSKQGALKPPDNKRAIRCPDIPSRWTRYPKPEFNDSLVCTYTETRTNIKHTNTRGQLYHCMRCNVIMCTKCQNYHSDHSEQLNGPCGYKMLF